MSETNKNLRINWSNLPKPKLPNWSGVDLSKKLINQGKTVAKAKSKLKYKYTKRNPSKTYKDSKLKDAVFNLQSDLYNSDYTKENNLDGVIGSNTRNAVKSARKNGYTVHNGRLLAQDKESYVPSNSPYALAHRGLIGNIYPYDYNPAITFDANNVSGYNEFLDLDLNTPEGRKRALEIRAMKQLDGKPLFSNRGNPDNKALQRQFRERYDLLHINAGKPLKYNSFRKYTDKDGKVFYEFSDEAINKRYTDRAYNTKKRFGVGENGEVNAYKKFDEFEYPVRYVPRDLTNVLFNQYTIGQKEDNLGKTSTVKDIWNLAPAEWMPGKEIAPNIEIDRYDDLETNREKGTEDMIVPNSVYHKDGSVRYDSNRKPIYAAYPSPASTNFVTDVILTVTKPYLNKISLKAEKLQSKLANKLDISSLNLKSDLKPTKIKLINKLKRSF